MPKLQRGVIQGDYSSAKNLKNPLAFIKQLLCFFASYRWLRSLFKDSSFEARHRQKSFVDHCFKPVTRQKKNLQVHELDVDLSEILPIKGLQIPTKKKPTYLFFTFFLN
jgi:hypothetical protein